MLSRPNDLGRIAYVMQLGRRGALQLVISYRRRQWRIRARAQKYGPLLTAIGAVLFASVAQAGSQTLRKVRIENGVIEGSVSGEVLSFKGIPYAAPPIRNYRWRMPQPVRSWKGVRDATKFGHDCMQEADPSDSAPSTATFSEDCLVLNVWRPAATSRGKKLPVLVWIHGGGYVNGGSSSAVYDGRDFARHGIVFISINYRLGRFGFFAHPAIIAANEGLVGNFAFMDQMEALRWVKRNIHAFGGNPTQITLMGESAGGASVIALLTSPLAKGIFQRAIVLSGGGRTLLLGGRKLTGGTLTMPSADKIGVNFADSVGISGSGPKALSALRALPASLVVGGLNMSDLDNGAAGPSSSPTYCGGPIIDNSIVIAMPEVILRRKKMARVPLIIGSTTQELSGLPRSWIENPLSYFGEDVGRARALYNPHGQLDPMQIARALGADMTMHEPARFIAKQMTQAGRSVWIYRFGYVAESMRLTQAAASHASELPFLFNTLAARYGRRATERDRTFATEFSTYFINFVKTGQPNNHALPTWPKFDPGGSELMVFTNNGPIAQRDPWRNRLNFVEQFANRLPNVR